MKNKIFTAFTLFILSCLGGEWTAASAQSGSLFGGNVPQAGQSLTNQLPDLPKADIYALDNDNTVWRRPGCTGLGFTREFVIRDIVDQVIGIDFRPADGMLYAVTDTGGVYRINTATGRATLVSPLTISFAGGAQSLADFNPVANALRLIGSNDQNYGVVNSGGDLNLTAAQTAVAYAPGDVNGGVDPNLVGGAYTNNVNGASTTIFYALDYDLDSLVTIAAPLIGAGSSNTAEGLLQTVGKLFNDRGQQLDIKPTADIDIYTINGKNFAVGVSGRTLFTIDLDQIYPNLSLGQTQQVAIRTASIPDGGFIDLAVSQRKCGRN
ncbi:MAG: DUF4394 domain-containing protein [Acidobacteria bacterium]|nr:DUF4394 domain-containing protein [Acidobacteriota bacterium]